MIERTTGIRIKYGNEPTKKKKKVHWKEKMIADLEQSKKNSNLYNKKDDLFEKNVNTPISTDVNEITEITETNELRENDNEQ
jgi:hypothetical protein